MIGLTLGHSYGSIFSIKKVEIFMLVIINL
jgi:hypothetical protein